MNSLAFHAKATLVLAVLFSTALSAQQLSVALSPNAPSDVGIQGGTAFTQELALLTLTASAGAVQVDGMTFTVGGSGDFVNDLDPATGLNVWQDDGDGMFDAGLDTLLGETAGAAPTLTVNFTSTLSVPDATSVDVWVVGDFLASAGASIADTYQISVANALDVNVQMPATVVLGTPAPDSATLSVVIFFINRFSPLSSYHDYGITIRGSGFTPPVSMSIGGVDLGTASTVRSDHEFAYGWQVPDLGPDSGYHDIVITTGLIGPIKMTQRFYYSSTKPHACGGDCHFGDEDCAANANVGITRSLVLLGLLAAIAVAARFAKSPKRL